MKPLTERHREKGAVGWRGGGEVMRVTTFIREKTEIFYSF
jgi:hypothetical protein